MCIDAKFCTCVLASPDLPGPLFRDITRHGLGNVGRKITAKTISRENRLAACRHLASTTSKGAQITRRNSNSQCIYGRVVRSNREIVYRLCLLTMHARRHCPRQDPRCQQRSAMWQHGANLWRDALRLVMVGLRTRTEGNTLLPSIRQPPPLPRAPSRPLL